MEIKKTIEKIPGGLMVVPLLLGVLLNTIDQMHLAPFQWLLANLGAAPNADGNYELLHMGSFTSALFKNGALTLIGLFLFCVGSQMDFRVGGRALKKGLAITGAKWLMAVIVGWSIAFLSDPYTGFLGLSAVAIIAAMSNGNGGLYVALTSQYGNRSDTGAISVVSLNDGPVFTLVALGLMGQQFPLVAFIAVLIPMALGFTLGQLDPRMREFLKPGESLVIPFFAFALGANMNLAVFLRGEVLLGGLFLGVMTVVLTGTAAVIALKLVGERCRVAGVAEASTAGNAVQTPLAVASAAELGSRLNPEQASAMVAIVDTATAQISISTITTAILCPLAVIFYSRWEKSRGIEPDQE